MARSLFSGILVGIVVAVLGVAVLSLMVGPVSMPQPEAASGSEVPANARPAATGSQEPATGGAPERPVSSAPEAAQPAMPADTGQPPRSAEIPAPATEKATAEPTPTQQKVAPTDEPAVSAPADQPAASAPEATAPAATEGDQAPMAVPDGEAAAAPTPQKSQEADTRPVPVETVAPRAQPATEAIAPAREAEPAATGKKTETAPAPMPQAAPEPAPESSAASADTPDEATTQPEAPSATGEGSTIPDTAPDTAPETAPEPALEPASEPTPEPARSVEPAPPLQPAAPRITARIGADAADEKGVGAPGPLFVPAPSREAGSAPAKTAPEPLPMVVVEPDQNPGAIAVEADTGPAPVPESPASPVVTNRLPHIGDKPAAVEPEPAPAPEPALKRNAVAFEAAGDRPLLSVLLLDTGGDRAALGDLDNLPFPVTVAVDASAADAAQAMAFYRAHGAEVALVVPLPAAATPSDVDVTVEAYAPLLEKAVAVVTEPDLSFQTLGPGAAELAANLAERGLGLVSYPAGLNTGHKAALKAGVRAGLVFRDLDGKGQTARVMRRFLDNAAFRARNEIGVIVVGHTLPATLKALLEWSLGTRAQSVALAPLSAVLERD